MTERFEQWKSQYEACHKRYATCCLVGHLGSPTIHPEVQEVIELHDFATKCNQALDLA